MGDKANSTDSASNDGIGEKDGGAPSPSIAPGHRALHPIVLVLIGVAASAVVFLAGGALMHAAHDGPRFDGPGFSGQRHDGPVRDERMSFERRGGGFAQGARGGDGIRGRMGGPGGPGMREGVGGRQLMRSALKSLGISDAELSAAMVKQVDAMLKKGDITAEQATAIKAHVEQEFARMATPDTNAASEQAASE